MNDQRKVIFAQRKEIMREEDVSDTIREMREETVAALVARRRLILRWPALLPRPDLPYRRVAWGAKRRFVHLALEPPACRR